VNKAGTPARRRVLEVIDSLHVGGAERVVLHLSAAIDRERFHTAVCCTKFRGILATQATDAGVQVFDISNNRGLRRYTVPWRLLALLREWRPDVVHTHGAAALLHVGPLALAGLLPPWVHTFHFGNYPHLPARTLKAERFFGSLANVLVAVSQAQRRAIAQAYGWPEERLRVVLNGVAARAASAPASDARQALLGAGGGGDTLERAPHEGLLVGTVAVLSEQKGIGYLLEAISALRQRHETMRFAIIGGGPMEESLRRESASLGLADVVTFTGWRTDALDLLPLLDVFVMPSLWEAMPMVLLEAMAAQRPIVVSDVGDNARIVEDGVSGLLIPARNAAAIVDAVHRLATDPPERQRLGRAARERFEARFTVDRMVRDYESVLSAV